MKEYTLDTNTVNRVRIENFKDFDTSLFASQYQRAVMYVSDILNNNDKVKSENETGFDIEISNTVSFLGGRGTGKTSAMFSFSKFLREYGQYVKLAESGEMGEGYKIRDDVTFLTLDAILASMLGHNEGVLEIVLARMWDYYEQIEKEGGRSEKSLISKERMAKEFSALKSDYQNYLEMSKPTQLTTIKQLHNLAGSMNLRKTFRDFVSLFLDTILENTSSKKEKYLVLTIDDVDMAGLNSYRILEQIHLFLGVPNIIILITADIERLNKICENHFNEVYFNQKFHIQNDEYKIDMRLKETLANEYLSKIIALNLRVYMPEIHTLNLMTGSSDCESINKKILKILFKNRIQLDCEREKYHFLVGNTLREVVNKLYEIEKLDSYTDYGANHIIDWFRNHIKHSMLEKIDSISSYDRLRLVFQNEIYEVNKFFIHFIDDVLKPYLNRYEYHTYLRDSLQAGCRLSEVLFGCHLLERREFNSKNTINFILAYYTLLLSENNQEDIADQLFKQSIFGNYVENILPGMLEFIRPKTRDGIQAGAPLSLLDITLTISREEILKCAKGRDKQRSREIKILLNSKFSGIRGDILAFQAILSFYDITKYRKSWAEKNIFDFSYEIRSIDNVKLDHSSNEDALKSDDNYVVVLKVSPQKDLSADFNIDYALCDVQNMKWICKSFKNNFKNGVIEQFDLALQHITHKDIYCCKEELLQQRLEIDRYYLYDLIGKWEKKHNTNTVFPVNNVELTYNIGRKLEEKAVYFDAERIYDIIQDIYDTISNELKERDRFLDRQREADNYFKSFRFYPVVYLFIKKDKNIKESLQKMINKLQRPLDFQHDTPLMD